MTGFRGDDAQLDREIAALQGILRVRLRRTTKELSEVDRELKELARERARRRATYRGPDESAVPAAAPEETVVS
jgi:sugar-specific transcriptional regulator TrmB